MRRCGSAALSQGRAEGAGGRRLVHAVRRPRAHRGEPGGGGGGLAMGCGLARRLVRGRPGWPGRRAADSSGHLAMKRLTARRACMCAAPAAPCQSHCVAATSRRVPLLSRPRAPPLAPARMRRSSSLAPAATPPRAAAHAAPEATVLAGAAKAARGGTKSKEAHADPRPGGRLPCPILCLHVRPNPSPAGRAVQWRAAGASARARCASGPPARRRRQGRCRCNTARHGCRGGSQGVHGGRLWNPIKT